MVNDVLGLSPEPNPFLNIGAVAIPVLVIVLIIVASMVLYWLLRRGIETYKASIAEQVAAGRRSHTPSRPADGPAVSIADEHPLERPPGPAD